MNQKRLFSLSLYGIENTFLFILRFFIFLFLF
jgi:hypothetical protein